MVGIELTPPEGWKETLSEIDCDFHFNERVPKLIESAECVKNKAALTKMRKTSLPGVC